MNGVPVRRRLPSFHMDQERNVIGPKEILYHTNMHGYTTILSLICCLIHYLYY
jgi:hypothetical protein